MGRLFGTDGVRGRANEALTADLALSLAVAAAHVLAEDRVSDGPRPKALVGRDPRASGEFLEAAVVAGLSSAGVDVIRLGIAPTPGVAHLVGATGADLGVMISASHNPMPDNGIKFFARGGNKLDDGVEDAIEAWLEGGGATDSGPNQSWQRPTGADVGRVTEDPGLIEAYIAHLVGSLRGADDDHDATSLEGITVCVDCANGAAWMTAVAAFEAQGARVISLHATPDGYNINDQCGSTHLGDLQRAVVEHGADLGIALDGDADRCLAVDADGNIVDGDQILAVIAVGMKADGSLIRNTVVATVMSNLGFVKAMSAEGISVEQTAVGDRYVLESMRAGGLALGGEQSGHVVMSQFATTGDGVLTGLHLMARMAATGQSLAELANVMTRLPQVLINVPNVDKNRASTDTEVIKAVNQAARELDVSGRVLLRPSGTESLVRVMVEAETAEQAQEVAERLAAVVKAQLQLRG